VVAEGYFLTILCAALLAVALAATLHYRIRYLLLRVAEVEGAALIQQMQSTGKVSISDNKVSYAL
jgi:hypothetical protein